MLKTRNDLNLFFVNGRQPQIFFMEDDLLIFINERQQLKFFKLKRTQFLSWIEAAKGRVWMLVTAQPQLFV